MSVPEDKIRTTKISRHLLAISVSIAILAASLHAATPEEQAVLAPIKAVFEGMKRRDAASVRIENDPRGDERE